MSRMNWGESEAELRGLADSEFANRRILAELNGQIDDLSRFVRPLQTRLTALRRSYAETDRAAKSYNSRSPFVTSQLLKTLAHEIAQNQVQLDEKQERLRSLVRRRQHALESQRTQSARLLQISVERESQLQIAKERERQQRIARQDAEARAREEELEAAAARNKRLAPELNTPSSGRGIGGTYGEKPVSHKPGGISRDPRESFARRNREW